MSVLSARNVLPLVTSVVATLFLATAAPRDLPSPDTSATLERAELQRCVADGRDADACLDEADGKALVERAEWQARADGAARRASR